MLSYKGFKEGLKKGELLYEWEYNVCMSLKDRSLVTGSEYTIRFYHVYFIQIEILT